MIADKAIQRIPYSIRKPMREFYEFSQKSSLKKLHSQFIQPGMLVFDIGANTGFYTNSFLDLGAKVICVEPQPYCIRELKHRLKGNPAVKILEMGVADKRGEMVLHIDSSNNTTATFSEKYMRQGPFSNRHWGTEINVVVTTLDDLMIEYGTPDFCKIDVEGLEYSVLSSLCTKIPVISFEFSRVFWDDAERCLDLLQNLGDIRVNFTTAYDFTRLKLKKWTSSKEEIRAEIQKSTLAYSGDIFVRFS
jgi:FkbM family methyltransferase